MDERDSKGRFKQGWTGGPGRPRLNGNGIAQFRALVNGSVEEIVNAVVANAKGGDVQSSKLILDRLFPVAGFQLAALEARLDQIEAALGVDGESETAAD